MRMSDWSSDVCSSDLIQTLPISLLPRIRQVDGVRDVTYANWFGGAYQDPRNQIFSFAVAPKYLDLYPEIEVSAAERAAFASTRTGVTCGDALMKRFGWKVRQKSLVPDSEGGRERNGWV